MADMNINAPAGQATAIAPPVRTDDQILPRIRWVPIWKRNFYLDMEKSQSNPIYKIVVDLLKHANFFKAFTASSTIPSIYIQQFLDTVQYDKTGGCYRCQLDEQFFVLTKDTLREALQITPVNNKQPFVTPPSSDALINFVNELGYPKLVRNLSNVVTNDMFQPWRALITIINLCLTGKTSGFERPMAHVLQILWGDKQNLSRHTTGKKKDTLIVISSIRFTKLIIHHLHRRHRFHPRPNSPLHLPNEEPVLGYLKFSAKGTKREVFGMPIPSSLITTDIQEASYYQEYLENVAKHKRYLSGETRSDHDSPASNPTKPARKPKSTAHKAPPRLSISTPATSAQPTPTSAPAKPQEKKRKKTTETSDKPPNAKKSKYGFIGKKRTLKSVAASVARDAPAKEPQGLLPPVVIREPESGKYQPLPEVLGKGKAKVTEEQESKKVVHGADEGGQDHEHMDLDVADVSPQPSMEQLDEGFTTTAYPKVQENLKLTVKEQVLLEDPGSSSGTICSLQHLSKDISFGDLFFSDKPSEANNDKATTETKVESMVSVTIQQDISSIPPMTSPIIDLTSRPESPKAMQAPLQNRFRDLPEADMKEIIHQRIWENESYKSHEDHMQLYEALENSMNHDHSQQLAQDMAEARKKKKKSRESPKTPPGSPPHQPPLPPPPAGPSGTSRAPGASGSSQVPPPPPPPSSTTQENLEMDEDMGPDEHAQSSNDADIGSAHIPKVNLRQDWWKPLEEERPATPKPTCVDDPILRHNVSKPLPLGGPPSQVTIQSDFFFNKDLEYLRYGSKGSRPALSISKTKTSYYPDAGLEQMVPDQFWIEKESANTILLQCMVSLNGGSKDNDSTLIDTHLKTQLNLTKPQWDATGFEYKHDYLVIDSPRAVMFRNKYEVQMMMRFNEIHKFSDGTLQQIDEALDYRVKELRINRMNPGLNTRFWTRKDVDRSKAFMFAIQKRLKTRIFRNLESFVGGCVREGNYRLLKRTE
uniref:Monodehydroascorbate reductase n=1 Tax=Tanacetum cinerariifolium TaxID=118510 RepID=A0A6L2NPG3_TANCI|nr:monodehydroascorbate reductase [Tanacetum cinerariifolium]